jgi:CheY-like chemotaxis protein
MDEPEPSVILLAEDDADRAFLICRELRKFSPRYEVCHATDGRRAWERLKESPMPVLLVTDLQMPDINGLELIERVRALRNFDGLPILVFSASVDPADRKQCERMAVDGYLEKRGSLGLVCGAVQRLLEKVEQADSKKSQRMA